MFTFSEAEGISHRRGQLSSSSPPGLLPFAFLRYSYSEHEWISISDLWLKKSKEVSLAMKLALPVPTICIFFTNSIFTTILYYTHQSAEELPHLRNGAVLISSLPIQVRLPLNQRVKSKLPGITMWSSISVL
ncbi:hypothetical protein DKX38_010458 [Salix brachista]|uniref:Uncharacterized protein n=1 Tax=Salix brachista TaxID=2182728 RepID=A0A5N5MDL1_9ROSI|nr:hypothetical protein DKX38_010458 [Salix brachista]